MPDAITPIALGLRERKKLKTKEAIQREALRLFQEQGYDETTIEQIAAAAEISPSTFFNYFPTKEDVVLFDRYDPMLESFVASLPKDEPLSRTIERALSMFASTIETDRQAIFVRAKLGLEVPEIRARFWEELEKAQNLFAGIVATRTGRKATDFELRVLAMVLVTASFEASVEWIRRGGEGDMFALVKEALDVSGVLARLDALGQPGATQARFVGQDHRLHAVPQVQLVEQMRDMSFHGGLGDVKARCDLHVAEPKRHLAQHIALAIRQPFQLFRLPRLRLGALGELLDQALGDRRREQGVARGDHADRVDEVLGRRGLEQERGGTGGEGVKDVLVQLECGEDHDPRE
ncbi:MAG: TetR family transcriptional regulator, partial [Chloroflexi bacterium]